MGTRLVSVQERMKAGFGFIQVGLSPEGSAIVETSFGGPCIRSVTSPKSKGDIMKLSTLCRHILTAAFFLAVLSIGHPLHAQVPLRVTMPGSAFSLDRREGQAVVEDVSGGRRFRGEASARLMLRAAIRIPPATSADPKLMRIVVHFRTSPSGPSLRSVALLNGTEVRFQFKTQLAGDYTARETTAPPVVANVWAFQPTGVSSNSVLRLEVQFPGGFDSSINPGEFVLTSVVVDFPRKGLPDSATMPANRPRMR